MSVTPDLLAALPLFSSLTPDELAAVAGWSERRTASPGERIVGEGASGYCFFVIRDGAAAVTQDGLALGRLGPGDFFGEMAILGDGRRYASVTTTAPSKVLVLFGTEFRRLQQDHPQIAEKVETAMRERAAQLG
jgi:CRP-like cAMP-binding protein